MGSPASRVDGSDRKFYVMAAERSPEGKEALKRFDATLKAQSPTSSSTGSNSLQNANVRTSQDQLTALGFDTGGSDGIAGPKTAAAVRAFQEANGLTVDGIIGPQTLRALEAATNKAAQPPGPPAPVDGSDRKFYVQASEKTGDPAILARFDQDLQTYNDFQTAQTPVDASDRKLYAQSDDPKVVEQFDRDLVSYNRVKENIANAYQHRVDLLVNEQGLEPAVAENLVTKQFEAQGLPRHALPASASTSQFDHIIDSSDRRFYMMASERANDGEGDPAILEQFDADSRAYNQYKGIIGEAFEAKVETIIAETGFSRAYAQHLVTQQFLDADTPSHLLPDNARTFQFSNPVDGSDRRLYMMASEQANDGQGDPTILERFDEAHAAYNDHKDVLATSYENRVQTLMQEQGYDRRLAEDMASLEFKSSLPTHLLPETAQSWNFGTSLDGSDRRLNPEAFDRDLAAQNKLQSVIGDAYSGHLQTATQQLMEERGYNEELAKHLAGLSLGAQLRASGIPASFLPESMTFNAGQALVDNYSIFDNALDSKDGLDAEGEAWTFGRLWDAAYDLRNRPLGLDNDGKVGLADLETIRDNPNDFPPDVAAAAIVLRTAADHDDELRSFFDQPNFIERLKDSPWLDPNTDSFVVNISRGLSSGGLSLLTADEFHSRLLREGPGTLEKVNNSLSQLDPINQGRLLITDRDQAFDNYRSFAGGAGDFFVDTAKLLGGAAAFANPALAGAVYEATGINVYAEATGMAMGAGNAFISDPDQMAQDIVGWDQFVEDPFRWAGNQAPDIILEIIGTKGASKAARVVRAADAASDVSGAARSAGRIDDIPDSIATDFIRFDSDVPLPPGGGTGPGAPISGGNAPILPRSRDLIEDLDAQFLRSDFNNGVTDDYLKLQDGSYVRVTEQANGEYSLTYLDGPPPPRTEDIVRLDTQLVPPRAQDAVFLDSALLPPKAADAVTPPIDLDHVLDGELKQKKKIVAQGFHHRPQGNDFIDARMSKLVSEPDVNGVYKGEVEIYDADKDAWVPKKGISTFFPDKLTAQQVEDAINNAWDNRTDFNPETGEFVGPSGHGFEIRGYARDNIPGSNVPRAHIPTAYPIYQK